MKNGNSTEAKQPSLKFREKIGSTIYEVSIHFSKTSVETISDKIKRLIRQDCTKFL